MIKGPASKRVPGVVLGLAVVMGSVASSAYPNVPLESWAARYEGPLNPPNTYEAPRDLEVSPDGHRVYVTGEVWGNAGYIDFATVAYDSVTGRERWAVFFDGKGYKGDQASGLAVSPDGSTVFVTGTSWHENYPENPDYSTVAYRASDGRQLWEAHYDGPDQSDDRAAGIVVSPEGARVFVTGRANAENGRSDYATIAYDSSSGTALWVARYDGSAGLGDDAEHIAVSRDGSRVFVSGNSGGIGTGGSDYATVAYRTNDGAHLWAARYDGPDSRSDSVVGLAVSLSGVFVTGRSETAQEFINDYATVAYDANGVQRWVARYDGAFHSDDSPTGIDVTPDGSRVFVTGLEHTPNNYSWLPLAYYRWLYDFATIAYDGTSGNAIWIARFDRPPQSDDQAASLVVSPDGSRVFVTGSSQGLQTGCIVYVIGCVDNSGLDNYDFETVAYEAGTGTIAWAERYNDGVAERTERAVDIDVAPDGSRVFVTGSSGTPILLADYVTISYCAEQPRPGPVCTFP